MKLSYPLNYEVRKATEKFLLWFVWKLPKWLIHWSAIRLIAYATGEQYSNTVVSELSALEALKRWDTA